MHGRDFMRWKEPHKLTMCTASAVQRSILAAEVSQIGVTPVYKEAIQIPAQYLPGVSTIRVSVEIRTDVPGSHGRVMLVNGFLSYLPILENDTVGYVEQTADVPLYVSVVPLRLFLYAEAAGTTGYARNFRVLCTDNRPVMGVWP